MIVTYNHIKNLLDNIGVYNIFTLKNIAEDTIAQLRYESNGRFVDLRPNGKLLVHLMSDYILSKEESGKNINNLDICSEVEFNTFWEEYNKNMINQLIATTNDLSNG